MARVHIHDFVQLIVYLTWTLSPHRPAVLLNDNKLENIQKRPRAIKLALNHSNEDYGQLLAKANLTTLEITRQKCILIKVYKSINNLNPVYHNDLFTRVNSVHFTLELFFATVYLLSFKQLKILIFLEMNYWIGREHSANLVKVGNNYLMCMYGRMYMYVNIYVHVCMQMYLYVYVFEYVYTLSVF